MAIPNKSLEIKTKSIESTLVPLVTQIATLVNFKEKPRSSSTTNEKTLQAINRVGDAVHMAVERFVSVGRYSLYRGNMMKMSCILHYRHDRHICLSLKNNYFRIKERYIERLNLRFAIIFDHSFSNNMRVIIS